MNWELILEAAMVLGGWAVIGVAGAYLRHLSSTETRRSAQMVAGNLVEAAEQLFESNEEKFDYVIALLRKEFPALNDTLLEALIEGAVFSMKQWANDTKSSDASSVVLGEKVG